MIGGTSQGRLTLPLVRAPTIPPRKRASASPCPLAGRSNMRTA